MEITADFDLGAVMRKLDAIERQAEELRAELPVEFQQWQEHDMNRRYASTRTLDTVGNSGWNFTRSVTTVLPTSRYRVKKRRRLVRRRLKKGGVIERQVVASRRPTLRPALIERFHERFDALLDRSFS